jgi:hypothetical protein
VTQGWMFVKDAAILRGVSPKVNERTPFCWGPDNDVRNRSRFDR